MPTTSGVTGEGVEQGVIPGVTDTVHPASEHTVEGAGLPTSDDPAKRFRTGAEIINAYNDTINGAKNPTPDCPKRKLLILSVLGGANGAAVLGAINGIPNEATPALCPKK